MVGTKLPVQVFVRKALKAATLAKRAVDAAARELSREAFIMERSMKKNVSVNFDILRSHIGVVGPKREAGFVSGVFYEVGVRGVDYAKFIEFGTGPAGAATDLLPVAKEAMHELGYVHGSGNFMPPVKEIERWLRRKGLPLEMAWPVARAIGLRGMKPHPFIFPAYEERRAGIPSKVSRAVARVLEVG
jgi:hypothetical protein